WGDRSGDPAFHFVSEGSGLHGNGGVAIFDGIAGGESGGKNSCRVCGGSRQKKESGWAGLFFDWGIGVVAGDGEAAGSGVDVCDYFWVFDGRGLYARSTSDGGMFRDFFAWKTAGADHYGIFAGAMGISMDRGKNI